MCKENVLCTQMLYNFARSENSLRILHHSSIARTNWSLRFCGTAAQFHNCEIYIYVQKNVFTHPNFFLHIRKTLLRIHRLKFLGKCPLTNSKCDAQLQVVKELVNLIFHAQDIFF